MKHLGTSFVLAEHKIKVRLFDLGAKLGFKKYPPHREGPTTEPETDRMSNEFRRNYFEAERRAVENWMRSFDPLADPPTYLDVGAGTGIFSSMALSSGAKSVVAVDILEERIQDLQKSFAHDPRFSAVVADARHLQFPDNSFDRVICLGNTFGVLFEVIPNGERSFQAEVLREMFRVARDEVVLTLQRTAGLRGIFDYYRANGHEVFEYVGGIARIRLRYTNPDGSLYAMEMRSQKFDIADILKLIQEAEIPGNHIEITPINKYNWLVRINQRPICD
jgi:ubiquinone/menaquinone biosynthesis C-methylase UbiE